VSLCVYALVSLPRRSGEAKAGPPARLRLNGIAGERLRIVRVGGLAAVVGDLRRSPAASAANLRKYARVVNAIAAKVPAILPARYATTVRDADELTLFLRARRAAWQQRLRAVRGRVQMTIRLLTPIESESGDHPFASRSTVIRRTRLRLAYGATQGTQYLKAKANAVPEFGPVRAVIARYIKDERVEKRAGVVTINHLVARNSAARYLDAVERAAAENGVRLIVSGPWPPYAFAGT
jgi:hypothetical protein